MSSIFLIARRLVHEQEGQDIVEYALLAAVIGVVGALVVPGIVQSIADAFGQWGGDVNDVWVPPDPVAM